MTLLVIMALTCCSATSDDAGEEECTPVACALDPCVDGSSPDEVLACCVETHGRGLTALAGR